MGDKNVWNNPPPKKKVKSKKENQKRRRGERRKRKMTRRMKYAKNVKNFGHELGALQEKLLCKFAKEGPEGVSGG